MQLGPWRPIVCYCVWGSGDSLAVRRLSTLPISHILSCTVWALHHPASPASHSSVERSVCLLCCREILAESCEHIQIPSLVYQEWPLQTWLRLQMSIANVNCKLYFAFRCRLSSLRSTRQLPPSPPLHRSQVHCWQILFQSSFAVIFFFTFFLSFLCCQLSLSQSKLKDWRQWKPGIFWHV